LDDVWTLELSARPKWSKVAELSAEVAASVAGDAALSSDDEEAEENERRGGRSASKGGVAGAGDEKGRDDSD
jgi:hypothetical protein